MSQLPINYTPVGELIPYARNSRTHSQGQVAQIVASISEFGWTIPVIADAFGIAAGHGRVPAAKKRIYEAGGIIRLPNGTENSSWDGTGNSTQKTQHITKNTKT